MNLIEEEVEKYLKLEHHGQPSKLLSMECYYDDEGLVLTQTTLIEDFALAHGINGVKHSLPADSTLFEYEYDEGDSKEYQQIVGGLLYISWQPPGSKPSTNKPSTNKPSTTNLKAAREICRYLLSTKFDGKETGEGGRLEVKIYTYASYRGARKRNLRQE